MKSYYHLKINHIDPLIEDSLTYDLFEKGAQGVSEVLDFEQPGRTYEPIFTEKENKVLEAYFLKPLPKVELEELQNKYANIQIEFTEEENKDWMEEWKKDFHAFELVSSIWLVPSWLEAPKQARQSIFIDPGMAFGTGTHATTQLCSRAIYELMKKEKIQSVIDVGCGTGILAILAELLGAKEVEATEIDIDARDCAIENVSKNECQYTRVLEKQIDEVSTQYDLVVANIIDGVLVSIKEDLYRVTRPGGYMILSGILHERESEFEKDFFNDEFDVLSKEQQDEWLSYVLRKK